MHCCCVFLAVGNYVMLSDSNKTNTTAYLPAAMGGRGGLMCSRQQRANNSIINGNNCAVIL